MARRLRPGRLAFGPLTGRRRFEMNPSSSNSSRPAELVESTERRLAWRGCWRVAVRLAASGDVTLYRAFDFAPCHGLRPLTRLPRRVGAPTFRRR